MIMKAGHLRVSAILVIVGMVALIIFISVALRH